MSRALLCVLFSIFTLGTFPAGEMAWADVLIGEGESFPQEPMTTPADAGDREYLGLSEGESFILKEVAADVVLVEILNVHCPHCQRQARAYNELFDLIEGSASTLGRIKMIGIAAGNDAEEVEDFRDIFEVSFPVIPDPRFRMHRAIGRSRTPYSIYVRQSPEGEAGVVAGTHLGVDNKFKELFALLQRYVQSDPDQLRRQGAGRKKMVVVATPIMSPEALEDRVKEALAGFTGDLVDFSGVELEGERLVFTSLYKEQGAFRRYFAEVTSRPSVCDVCHDVHFIYVFDAAGKVLRFVPLQLTKYGNEDWSEADIRKMSSRVVGRYITAPLAFDREVDAVTSATITSVLIFDTLSRGASLMAELKEKGLL